MLKGANKIMDGAITYTMRGDYLIPDIRLASPPEGQEARLGTYARMRKAFLKNHRKITYSSLILKEKLYPHLREVDEAAAARLEVIMIKLTAEAVLPDKASDQMAWAAAMEGLKAQAEEIILQELIYA
jgi:hypothetical protein